MDSYEPHTHSFVVKVWLEEEASSQSQALWRGHVTHVFSGERRYFQSMADLTAFIEGYLWAMGAQPTRPSRFSWLSKLRRLNSNSEE